jgi:hypothetical protein
MEQTTQVTLAAATGLVRLALVVHIGAGLLALVSGFAALFAPKGGWLHRRGGMLFVCAMIVMATMAAVVAAREGKAATGLGAPFTIYLVFTAMTAVRPVGWQPVRLAYGLMALALAVGVLDVAIGVDALRGTGMTKSGVPGPMVVFMGVVALAAGAGDLRMLRAGGLRGTKRIARHLWRMCFALFIASGSFFLGQARTIPEPARIPALLWTLALAPLVALLYWMWRVRGRGRLPARIPAPAGAR